MSMKKILIVNKEKPRNEIIRDITKEAREIEYKKDNLARRLKGCRFVQEQQFFFMLKKICLEELKPMIKDVLICDKDKFEEYLEKY